MENTTAVSSFAENFTLTSETEFTAAANMWLNAKSSAGGSNRARYIRKNTEESYKQYIASLGLFFKGQSLGSIRLRSRQAGTRIVRVENFELEKTTGF
jgi:hypothetical protein